MTNDLHHHIAGEPGAQLAHHIGRVARELFGQPNKRLSKKHRLRYGTHGSLSIDLRRGVFYDHENNVGGGVLAMIEREKGLAGKDALDWMRSVGCDIDDEVPRTNGAAPPGKPEVFDYEDENGATRFQVLRYTPKGFAQRRPTENGWENKGGPPIPFRLPQLIKAVALGQTIFVVEGEGKVELLRKWNIAATCNAGGAGKWTAEHSKHLRNADVVILPDNDEPGHKHRDCVGGSLQDVGARVRVLDLPGLGPKGDIVDWAKTGGTAARFWKLVETDAKPWAHAQSPTTRTRSLSIEELSNMRFNPIKYVVPGVIVEGLTLLAGKPKMGKSWLLLHAAVAVARGGFTLGDIHCPEGDVLYCALEDNLRRLQSRLTKLLGLPPWPKRMHVLCEMPRLAEGGLAVIKDWITTAKHPRFVIVDTLAMVRTMKKRDQTNYEADYEAVKDLRAFAAEHGVAVVLVHHLRKQESDDAFDTVSGTLGLTGAVDTVLIIKRDTRGNFVLHGRGRDLVEIEKAMTFDKEACTWRIAGEVAEVRASGERKAILAAIRDAGEPLSPKEIAEAAQLKRGSVRNLLAKMAQAGDVQKLDYGKYAIAGNAAALA